MMGLEDVFFLWGWHTFRGQTVKLPGSIDLLKILPPQPGVLNGGMNIPIACVKQPKTEFVMLTKK